LAFLHVDTDRRPIKKLSETSVTCVFLGFAMDLGHKGYLLKQLNRKRFFISMRSVTFDMTRFPYLKPIKPEDAAGSHDTENSLQLDFQQLEDINVDEESLDAEPPEVEIILEDEGTQEPDMIHHNEASTIGKPSLVIQ
jgi:hypothetical protein